MRSRSGWTTLVLNACFFLCLAPAQAVAQDAGPSRNLKNLDKAAYDSLRDIINHGADLFNNQGDFAGCYHAYQAGLIAVRPFLAHHPDLQNAIDQGLEHAEASDRVASRAFALRK